MPTRIHVTTESLKPSADNWNSTYALVCSLSASWEESQDILPTVTQFLSTNTVTVCSLQVTDLYVLSSFFVAGTATFLQQQDLAIESPVVYLAQNNVSDILDLGVVGAWTNSLPAVPEGYQYGGFIRRADTKQWLLFSGASAVSGVNIDWTNTNIKIEALSADFYGNIYGDRTVYGNLNILNGITVVGNISGNNVSTSFNEGSATGFRSFAVGSGAAQSEYSFAEGQNTIASGNNSHAEGQNTIASGNNSHAEGSQTIASGTNSHAEGLSAIASGNNSHAEGLSAIASGNNSHAEGSNSQATNTNSHAEGAGTIASGINSHAEGSNSQATNIAAHAEGSDSQATNIAAHAEGQSTKAFGYASHAEGLNTTASASNSHAEGNNTEASAESSHAEGSNTIARGSNSHAEGTGTRALEPESHAEGNNTEASGFYAHSEGFQSQAKAIATHAGGYKATAAHGYSYAWSGDSTLTQNVSTTRTSQYMISAPGGVFIPGSVGVGTDTINNALTIVGNISATGTLYGDGSNLTGVTTNPLPTVINYLSTDNVQVSSLNVTQTLTVSGNISTTGKILSSGVDVSTLIGTGGGGGFDPNVPINGNLTVVGSVSAQGKLYGDGSSLTGIVASNSSLIKILSEQETTLSASNYGIFFKTVSADNTFLYYDFNEGNSITLYLSANHGTIARHRLPSPTYLSNAGISNEIYTYNGHITKTTIQRVGGVYYGISDVIKTNILQNVGGIGRILLEDSDYLLQEDSSRILLAT